tara:strand:+ start:9032 stop:10108 length:1077 start_codon:yes stop_codon:yes gene_type:complete
MKNYKVKHVEVLYIFFVTLSLIIFFFSTTKLEAKSFDVNNIEISRPFEINFNKNEVIDEGFKKGFLELLSLIVNSNDQKRIKNVKLNEIKATIESFTIKEEKFIDEIYYVNLGVSFNKKKIYKYLELNNIFPSIPKKKNFLFIPIIIDENEKDLLIFSKNKIFKDWNNYTEKFHLINYILPTEDLEDINIIKAKYENIEEYDFREILEKYVLDNSIIVLIFKNEKNVRILSRISIKNNVILKNNSFIDIDIKNDDEVKNLIKELKLIYEDFWKSSNQINTSIKLVLKIKVDNSNNDKISRFEKILDKTDLIYDFYISKLDKDFTFYQIIFNGTTNEFLKSMNEYEYNFDTQNKLWILK